MKSAAQRKPKARVKNPFPNGKVELRTGEAVVGRVGDMFAVQGTPDELGRVYLYFSAPGPTFLALEAALKGGGLQLSAERGSDMLADSVIVRVRAVGHCVYIVIPSDKDHFSSALQGFVETGKVRVAVASQAVKRQPLVFESDWRVPEGVRDGARIRLEHLMLLGESQMLGTPSQLVTCEAETPQEWKSRVPSRPI